ncbi:unnamed protein product [Meloidogyne enterolobii]|uniref:Uncharacterized protein n=1 Tax=Meloidogyne enterolobii TaxID=390850 RepID=A0ACB0ZLQ0_MELEN
MGDKKSLWKERGWERMGDKIPERVQLKSNLFHLRTPPPPPPQSLFDSSFCSNGGICVIFYLHHLLVQLIIVSRKPQILTC